MIFGHEPWCNRIVTIDGKHYDRQTGRCSCGAPPEPEAPPFTAADGDPTDLIPFNVRRASDGRITIWRPGRVAMDEAQMIGEGATLAAALAAAGRRAR